MWWVIIGITLLHIYLYGKYVTKYAYPTVVVVREKVAEEYVLFGVYTSTEVAEKHIADYIKLHNLDKETWKNWLIQEVRLYR